MSNLVYSKNLFSGTREELVQILRDTLSEKRFQHVLNVEKSAIELAERNNGDRERASIAGLIHDYAKERSDETFITVIKQKHLDPDLLNWGNAIWHGIVGAELIHDELGILDNEILTSIVKHTTGDVDMTLLDKIVYVADFIEESRTFPGAVEARKIATVNLDTAVGFETKHTLSYLIDTDKKVYPKTILTFNKWVAE
ncbi:bis(5'-nucleosyl)-tetraphosphatase (symmetrical) YqeK [Dellaglioa algida]|uniref:bis(5'-nucleosyl)-tetraphosphatase (symmetrical) n=1 Tax=Dellaglioa algida TaxID=105612 RepID=A0A5C6M794_9LACO|nr:bis(5'-nucleosyl)-tetraphosphatase (symmetrical) YqeK [Dellaglioa algida]MDK1716703.1 bis(5'-nucleosyl)-tetraphosphatase (symmetrical) YqeK [Dellaglioa algida]MDK1720150.1 bis(5'-nucleosyl)-tetraphosphatase (symmetrical) YqeK [Dellaglioa algida]MDK1721645.1 bis(5'-nucleosyl)-tetraphosphatase (symmetrical) YqeK [Dellaglioa algida]MDK1723539.1 bis(5'-nucleosyl)-tetraphosphatase (symmetrical) YqeK [Dellaglioa algida]MDK1725173.1 bis(5'-nucleosyl)-tetraphosphatase (symmetrical) YqeK [Dellaglioa